MEPLKLIPAFKDYLWGGTKLVDEYNKKTNITPVAESWEISCHQDGPSIIGNGAYKGKTLTKALQDNPDWIGEGRKDFPVLVKLIDAKQSLSVQVHPKDTYAREHEGEQGKNEMWYVLEADEGAELIVGFTKEVTKEELRQRIENNTILEVANSVPVKAGDCYPIPAGTLHAIGAGCLIAEVQQNSNTTYRVYDYNRRDAKGNPRELHIDKAIDVVDSTLKTQNVGKRASKNYDGYKITPLVEWEYFSTHKIDINEKCTLVASKSSFNGILVLSGRLTLGELSLAQGDSVFVPAGMGEYALIGQGEAILVAT